MRRDEPDQNLVAGCVLVWGKEPTNTTDSALRSLGTDDLSDDLRLCQYIAKQLLYIPSDGFGRHQYERSLIVSAGSSRTSRVLSQPEVVSGLVESLASARAWLLTGFMLMSKR